MRSILIAVIDNPARIDDSELYQQLLSLENWPVGKDYQINIQQLPCVFKHSLTVLEQLITQFKPAHMLLINQCRANVDIRIEKVALNINDASEPDNHQQQPRDTLTAQHGPAAYFSNLPVSAIVDTLHSHALPARLSYSAGTFVANHLFYGLMHYIKHQNISLHGGLMQVPLSPAQASRLPGSASLSTSLAVDAVKLAINVSLAHSDNMLRSTG
ncbi:MAG TPA: pyroglutamyl-peptidase I [Rheinheimera sp.]|uniref:pyroglutamyl-peptidase I family protein n=1 Tax=Rheinheimera sp. TaxID=1869214 RepID=UPI002F92B4A6